VANDVSDERFNVVTKLSDTFHDARVSPSVFRVIEAPSGLKSLATLEGSRDPSVASSPPSSRPLNVPLTAESASLVESLAVSASAARSSTPRVRVAVALIKGCDSGEGLGKLLESRAHCKCELVTPDEIRAGALNRFDVVLFPGGQSSKQATELGVEGIRIVRGFVENGGGYIGVCAGGILACAASDWSLGLVNAKTLSDKREIPGPDGIMAVDMGKRHSGIVQIELTEAGRKVFGDLPGLLDTLFALGPVFLPAGRTDLREYVSLAHYRSEIWLHESQRGTMVDTPAILAARFGRGHVIVFGSHPEVNNTPSLQSMLARAVLATARKPADR
jgi:glutamine amidotransferase-like uncharacterized protein